MSDSYQTTRDHLFALSNFIASFGGGVILGKGMKVLSNSYFQDGSVLAFFAGITLGLIFLYIIPNHAAKTYSRWFSIAGGVSSIVLLSTFTHYSTNNQLSGQIGIFFFILLSIRFGLWFFSRAVRASSVAGKNQGIAWVELGYYLGMISGLIIWKLIGLDISLITALIIDASLQFIAGFLDLIAYHSMKDEPYSSQKMDLKVKTFKPKASILARKLAFSVAFLTMGVQVIIMSLSHHFPEYFSSLIIAAFYFGAAIAAMFSKKMQIGLEWNNNAFLNIPKIIFKSKNSTFSINSIHSGLFVICIMASTLFFSDHIDVSTNRFLFFVFLSAFLYEIIALALLEQIGVEEKRTNISGMVMRTYGLMGASAAIGLWLISLLSNSFYFLVSMVGICIFLSCGLMIDKKSTRSFLQTS